MRLSREERENWIDVLRDKKWASVFFTFRDKKTLRVQTMRETERGKEKYRESEKEKDNKLDIDREREI